MDPRATLRAAHDALAYADYEQLAEHLANYFAWRISGGFQPENGDNEATNLLIALGKNADDR